MGYWNTRGLRGSVLEELVNRTNDIYREKNLALVQKIPTPITPVQIDNETRTIKLAYFEKKSTVDFIGVVQGIPICFDAKETHRKSFPLQNIHEHQVAFMAEFEQQQGIAFILVHFTQFKTYHYLPFQTLKTYWDQSMNGSRKSMPYKLFEEKYIIENKDGYMVHYLESLQVYLNGL